MHPFMAIHIPIGVQRQDSIHSCKVKGFKMLGGIRKQEDTTVSSNFEQAFPVVHTK